MNTSLIEQEAGGLPSDAGDFCFPRRERLKKRAGISLAFKKGFCVTVAGAKLFCVRNGLPYNRIAFTFARNFGKAHERNRARRLGRECYRHIRAGLVRGWDMVLLVYTAGKEHEPRCAERSVQFAALVRKAGLLIKHGF